MRLTVGMLRQVIKEEVMREMSQGCTPPAPPSGYRGDFAERTAKTGHGPQRNNKEGTMGWLLRALAKDLLQDENERLGVPMVHDSNIRGLYPESEIIMRDGNRYQVPTKKGGTTKSSGASWTSHLRDAMRTEGHDDSFIEEILGLLDGTTKPTMSSDPRHPRGTQVVVVDGQTYVCLPGQNSMFVHESDLQM